MKIIALHCYNSLMRDALFGLAVAVTVAIGTGMAAVLLILIAVATGSVE